MAFLQAQLAAAGGARSTPAADAPATPSAVTKRRKVITKQHGGFTVTETQIGGVGKAAEMRPSTGRVRPAAASATPRVSVSYLESAPAGNANEGLFTQRLRDELKELKEEKKARTQAETKQAKVVKELEGKLAKAQLDARMADEKARLLEKKFDLIKDERRALDAELRECKEKSAALQRDVEAATNELKQKDNSLHRAAEVRRMLHNSLQELKGNIRVFARVRPAAAKEVTADGMYCFPDDLDGRQLEIVEPDTQGVCGDVKSGKKHAFEFDKVFSPCATQSTLFNEVQSLVQSTLDGYKVCVFAYGQTGSGKSHTMFGNTAVQEEIGIIPRITHKIFNRTEKEQSSLVRFRVKASYMEIYNERVKCLLNPSLNGESLKVREHPEQGPYVENLTQMEVKSHQEVFRIMHDGNKLRTTAATNMNAHSSRSHALFQLQVSQEILMEDCDEVLSSKTARLNLVDLAGSERASKTHATGTRLQEGANINKSLTTLGQVISSLADGSQGKARHIPYRDSVLTWILKDNLGGNSKTIMIATVSPSSDNYEETMSTLRYAERAKKIVNKAVVNEDQNSALVAALKEEIAKLQTSLSTASDSTHELEANRALMQQLQMSWEEKLTHAHTVAETRGEQMHHVMKEKEELEAELEGLMLERAKRDEEIEHLQQKLNERDGQVEHVLKQMKDKEQEYEARLRKAESAVQQTAAASPPRPATVSGGTQAAAGAERRGSVEVNPDAADRDEFQHELHSLRQQMAVMSAQIEAHKSAEALKKELEAGLPAKVQALLHTLQIESVTDAERQLLQRLHVKDMAMVYDQLGEGADSDEVWTNLLLRLESKPINPIRQKNPYDNVIRGPRQPSRSPMTDSFAAEESSVLDSLLGDDDDDADGGGGGGGWKEEEDEDLVAHSPRKGRAAANAQEAHAQHSSSFDVSNTIQASGAASGSGPAPAPAPAPYEEGLGEEEEGDVLNALLDDGSDDDDAAAAAAAKEEQERHQPQAAKLLERILGAGDGEKAAAEKDDGDELLDALLPSDSDSDSEAGDDSDEDALDALLDDSDKEGSSEDDDVLDGLLDDDDEDVAAKKAAKKAKQHAKKKKKKKARHVDPASHTEHCDQREAEKAAPPRQSDSHDVLDDLLGDGMEAAQEERAQPRKSTGEKPAAKVSGVKITKQGDKLDVLRTLVWNATLFNAHAEVAAEGEACVAALFAQAVKDAEPHRVVAEYAKSKKGVVPVLPQANSDYATRLANFYIFYNKSRLPSIGEIVGKVGKSGKEGLLISTACKKYMGAEPPLLTEPPAQGIKDLINSHWFWGPVLSGKGPPAFVDEEEGEATDVHPLMDSPKAARKLGQVDEKQYWRGRLQRFFRHYNQKRSAENIDSLLANFKGIENQMMMALVARYGPEPGGPEAAQSKRPSAVEKKSDTEDKVAKEKKASDAYGSTSNPIRLDVNSVEEHGVLVCGFRVLKINPKYGKMKEKLSKDRVWVLNFFKRTFENLSGNRVTQTYQASHLFRIEKLHQHPKQLRLSFYKAPHPYILEFLTMEARQRFYELAWAMRRHICWLPDLVPKTHNAVSVNILGQSRHFKHVNGCANFHLTRDPFEMLTIWCGMLSLKGVVPPPPMTPAAQKLMQGFFPKNSKYELHFVILTDLPDVFSQFPMEAVKYFKPYCQQAELHPFLSTNLGGSDSVVLALARRRHISKVGSMEAIELRDSNTSVVGLSLRYGESTIALVTCRLNAAMSTMKKNQKVGTIMRKLEIGDCRLEFTSRFDYVIFMGNFGYGGIPHEADDELAQSIAKGCLLTQFAEPSVSGKADTFNKNSARIFVKTSRPNSFQSIYYTALPPFSNLSNSATIFAGAFAMQRPYLSALIQQKPKPKPTQYFFMKLQYRISRMDILKHLGPKIQLAVHCQFMEGAPVMVEMDWQKDKGAYVVADEDSVPPCHLVTPTEDFLKRQMMTFTVVSPTSSTPDFPYTGWATSVLSLRHYTPSGQLMHFQCSAYRTALKLGIITGEAIRIPAGGSLATALHKAKKETAAVPLVQ
eukprot:TRINITY_DN3005_c0_g2_i4.p1 TRINITY_DN3005_c0_g2~~TRINITY_DN3005_c0_g2_i4.p1  ORF type:complete len:2237 (+),score=915.86 TRINITY_DN3005_c0_g2_i4:640-6711(+)